MIGLFLPFRVGARPALAAPAVAAPQVIGGGKHHAPALEVEIPVLQRRRLHLRRCRAWRLRLRPRLESIPWRGLHLLSNPIRVDTDKLLDRASTWLAP